MNKVQIRDAIVDHLNVLTDLWDAEGRSMHVEMENQGDIDLNNVGDEFICFDIVWNTTKQKNIAENPDHRYYGDVVMMLLGKRGTGTRKRLLLEDEITDHFKFKQLSGVQLQEPTPSAGAGRSGNHPGWESATVMFQFFADSNTPPI